MADTPPPEVVAAKSGGTNKIVLLAAMVVAAGVAAGGTFFLTRPKEVPPGAVAGAGAEGKPHAAKPKAEPGEEEEEGEEPAEEGGKEYPVVNLPAFTVNLGDDMNDPHYLKLAVAVEINAEGEDATKGFDSKSAKVRGAILLYLSGLKLEDVQGQENRKKILAGVRKEVRRAGGRTLVRNSYITEMVVQ